MKKIIVEIARGDDIAAFLQYIKTSSPDDEFYFSVVTPPYVNQSNMSCLDIGDILMLHGGSENINIAGMYLLTDISELLFSCMKKIINEKNVNMCIMCRMVLHACRYALCKHIGVDYIMTGERLRHTNQNENAAIFTVYDEIFNDIEFIRPVVYLEDAEVTDIVTTFYNKYGISDSIIYPECYLSGTCSNITNDLEDILELGGYILNNINKIRISIPEKEV